MLYSHNRDIDVGFYNDKVKEVIDPNLVIEPFTYVPIRAGHMELVSGNSIVLGNMTEGYDPFDLNVETEVIYEDIASDIPTTDLVIQKTLTPILPTDFYDGIVDYVMRRGFLEIIIPVGPAIEGAFYIFHGESQDRSINITAFYVAIAGDTHAQVKAGLEASILAQPGFDPSDLLVSFQNNVIDLYPQERLFRLSMPGEAQTGDALYNNWEVIEAYILDFGQEYSTKFPVLKHGVTHSFGIVYKDGLGRHGSVLRHEALEVYLPFFTEENGPEIEEKANLTIKIWNDPPDWAETYEIVYAGNVSISDFLQIRIFGIAAIAGDINRFTLNIQETLDHTRNLNNRWKLSDWQWNDGDRIRLIGTIDSGTGAFTKYAIDDTYDYEIEELNVETGDDIGAGNFMVIQAVNRPVDFDGEVNIVAEIYRPNIGFGTTTYFGTGMVFPISTDENGNRFHEGDINQSFNASGNCLTPAEIYNTSNDAWLYPRLNYRANTTVIQMFWAESNVPSDWWRTPSRLTSEGRPYLYDMSQRQVSLPERLRHGGKLIEGTRVNEIAHFTFDKFIDLPRKNGQITGLKEIGYTLKVLQMYKETSIYIERIQTFNPDGTEQFTLISGLLGTQRPEETDFGCQHPESVTVNDRYLYYWDNSEGKVIRSAPNGQVPISDIKMKRWFKDLLVWINQNGGAKKLDVYIGINVEHDEVWICYMINNLVEGAIFSEKQGRWITRIDQRTESYIHLGNWFAHMYKQRLYIMNLDEGQAWLSWAGINTVGEVQFPSNINPLKNKVFNAIAVYSDHPLVCLSRYITIPQEASFTLLETYIAVWDEREGVYYGKILKDQNSPGSFVSENAKTMSGREMRGRYCYFRLRTSEHTEKVRLDSVIIMSTNSERSS